LKYKQQGVSSRQYPAAVLRGRMAKRITLKIEGMECPNCAMILERIEDKLNGVLLAEASYHKAQMLVEYNEAQVTEEKIVAEIQRMGYSVASINANSK
jgi:copper chaperone CopZ